MNLTAEDLASGVLRDRVKVGASLADVDPMNLDSSVSGKAHSVKQQFCPSCLEVERLQL